MKWTKDQTDHLKELCMAETPNADIALRMGIPIAEVYNKRSDLGLTIPKIRARLGKAPLIVKPEFEAAVVEMEETASTGSKNRRPQRNRDLEEAAKPLIDFLYKYGCPHSCVIVTQTSAELLSGECAVPFESRD